MIKNYRYNNLISNIMALKKPIIIKKENRGKFNALKKRTGKSTE